MAVNTIEFSKLEQNRENSYFFKPPCKRHYLPYMNEIVSITYLKIYNIFTFQPSFLYLFHADNIIMENQKMLQIVLSCDGVAPLSPFYLFMVYRPFPTYDVMMLLIGQERPKFTEGSILSQSDCSLLLR